MPHQEYLTSEKDNEQFQVDYSFIELINDVTIRSPWKAKEYQQYKNKTHK